MTGMPIKKSDKTVKPVRWPSITGSEPIEKSGSDPLWPSFNSDIVEKSDDDFDEDDDNDGNQFENFIPIIKQNDAEHIVCGVVYEPDTEDSQGDMATESEIRKAAYNFMEGGQVFKTNHSSQTRVKILESYVAPADIEINSTTVKKGSWILTLRVLSEGVWKKIKSGKLTGFSMAGTAERAES